MSENDSNKKGGWFSGIFSSILSRGTQDRKRPRRSEEVEEEPTHSTSTIDSIVVNEPKRMRSDLSIREGPKSLRTSSLATADGPQRLYSESHSFTDRPNISYSKFVHSRVQDESINEPLSNSTIELYPSSASRSIDFRSKILQPPSRTQQILNELDRISSPKPNISKLPSLKRWEELEEWSHDPTKYKSPLPPKKSLFTPTRLHEITARYARGSPKPYWRRPFFNNSWAARQDQSSLATSIEKPVADEDVQILEPSTSKASADKQTPVAETTAATTFGGLRKTPEQTTAQVTKTTSLFSTTTTEERRIPTLFEERRPHVPVLKGPSGRNVAPNLKSNVFKVPDEDLVVEREEINENDLSKVKPLPFKPSIPAGFLTSQNDQQFAFSFSQPIEREPKAIFSQDLSNEKLFEKQTSPERKNGTEMAEIKKMRMAEIKLVIPNPFQFDVWYRTGLKPITLQELKLLSFEAAIRLKKDWTSKIFDESIVAKWKTEYNSQQDETIDDSYFDYAIAECRYQAESSSNGILMSPVDGVFQADGIVPQDILGDLLESVTDLENRPFKDWHPGSNGQVLNLVHPSLYPYVYGVNRQLPKQPNNKKLAWNELFGRGEIQFFQGDLWDKSESKKFQWLPSEFVIDSVTGAVQIDSYINNLHPEEHESLYATLEKIFSKFVPMFEILLTRLVNPIELRLKPPASERYEHKWYVESNVTRNRRFIDLKPGAFKPPNLPKNVFSLKGKRLQVIVNLANIHLTPEKPSYPGGVWHVEGMRNESIVASGIYYYDMENITESRLSFRQKIAKSSFTSRLTNGMASNQELGYVCAEPGRLIVFPNIFQHKVEPFELVDKTRPGHRKTLVFFLVDPNISILSTERVPPQQNSWFFKEVCKIVPQIAMLPDLVKKRIQELLPITLDQAKIFREEFMKERKYYIEDSNDTIFKRPIQLFN